MEKNKAIPNGYMTVGEVAKKMGVTVRTLQYYHKEGLFSPSAKSEGGLRLYTDKDVIQLHQILSLKHLGFSLDDIKNRITTLDTPAEVAQALAQQAAALQQKLESLAESIKALEALRAEVLQMQTVDFKKYADIIVNLQMKNDSYWLIKYFDDQTLDYVRTRFNKESGLAMMDTTMRLRDEAIRLLNEGVPPESEQGQAFAAAFWQMILEFTEGDMTMLPKLMEIGSFEGMDGEWKEKQMLANTYVNPALELYLSNLGFDPFKEENQ